MLRHKSTLKRARQTEKRRARNVAYRSRIKTLTKRVNERLKEGDKEKTETTLRLLVSVIDKAVQKGIIHKNTASRKKSNIAQKVNKSFLSAHSASLSKAQELGDEASSPVT
ncbi:TPA: 30S ribosomal protein S20 [bacterium]|nr:30S ribosomal protein S20 [bacterium]